MILASRASPLALRQSEMVKEALFSKGFKDLQIITMTTQGDRYLHGKLQELDGKGLFVKEIQESVLRGDAHVAVHSLKDVPVPKTPGLKLIGVLPRDDVRDVVVFKRPHKNKTLSEVLQGKCVGTTSLRRKAQLQKHFQCEVVDLRGNVQTRLKKLEEGNMDAIILALAGLQRMSLEETLSDRLVTLDPTIFIPSAAQGAIILETKDKDEETIRQLQPILCHTSSLSVICERLVLKHLNASCQTTVGAYLQEGTLYIQVEANVKTFQVNLSELIWKGDFETTFDELLKAPFSQELKQFLCTF